MGINQLSKGSYSPSINNQLVSLQSIKRQTPINCNNERAFKLMEPLEISIPNILFGNTCVQYNQPKAIKFLMKNLAANKHVNVDKIIPPKQSRANCWFNAMFVVLFVSDKGRKFFHFFRQLMIEGKQADGQKIPEKLRNGFALLNYAVDICLTGNEFAYTLDTNAIIEDIYKSIPESYKEKLPYITNVEKSGNPMRYYGSIIYYLHNKSLSLEFIRKATIMWKQQIQTQIQLNTPHLICLEFYATLEDQVTNKPKSFTINGARYSLDSCIIRDTTMQHFSAALTCDHNEMGYDGMSFHRLEPLIWQKYINTNFSWSFEGSNDINGAPLQYNFLNGYQMLLYYRVK